MRVLVVEDEPKMAALVARALREEGHPADIAARGADAALDGAGGAVRRDRARRDAAGSRRLRSLRELRAAEVWTPVLMLTARDAVADRVGALDAGADDYLTKPFSFAELLARLRAVVAPRPGRAADGARGRRPAARSGGAPRLARRAEIELSTQEFALLELLMRRAGQTLTRLAAARRGVGHGATRAGRTSSTSTCATSGRRSTVRSGATRSRRCGASGIG